MTHLPTKKPTDAGIVKALTKYEEGFNVFLAAIRNDCPTDSVLYNSYPPEDLETHLYNSLAIARSLAVAAQRRIDAKKEGEDG